MKPIINTALCAFRLRASLGPGAQFAHLVFSVRLILLVANPTLGQAIADIGREGILQSDGTCVGSIMSSGFGLGPTAPGAPDGCSVRNAPAGFMKRYPLLYDHLSILNP